MYICVCIYTTEFKTKKPHRTPPPPPGGGFFKLFHLKFVQPPPPRGGGGGIFLIFPYKSTFSLRKPLKFVENMWVKCGFSQDDIQILEYMKKVG